MSFRGPSRSYDYPTTATDYLTSAIDRMARGRTGGGVGRVDTDALRMDRAEQSERERLSVADRLAREQMRMEQDAAVRSRNAESLGRMDAQAEANRAQMLAAEAEKAGDGDPAKMLRQRLAEYVRQPSRQAAAEAVRAGANLNLFPDRYAGEPGYAAPEGTPEYYQNVENQLQFETRMKEKYGGPPAPRQVNLQTRIGSNGNFWAFDPGSGRMFDTGVAAGEGGAGGPAGVPFGAGGTLGASGASGAAGGASSAAVAPFSAPAAPAPRPQTPEMFADSVAFTTLARDPRWVAEQETTARQEIAAERGAGLAYYIQRLMDSGLDLGQVRNHLRNEMGYSDEDIERELQAAKVIR